MHWVVVTCLAWSPVWEPVESLVARADVIVDAEVAADGRFAVVHASLKGRAPASATPGLAGRALLFFAGGLEIGRWRALESGEFDLPDFLLVPLDWKTRSASRDAVVELLTRRQHTGGSFWTVNEQECEPCRLSEAFIQRAFSTAEDHVICVGDAGVDCVERVRVSGAWGATKPKGDSFVWVMDGGVEVISFDRRRDRPSFCGGARLVSTRCQRFTASGCLAPSDQRVLCEETRAERQVPLSDARIRCLGADVPVERSFEVGAIFSCGRNERGVPLSALWPRGRCFRERFERLGSMRCEGLNADGGSAGHLRAGVFE